MGKLTIYTGPMKSGKTTKLLEKYKKVNDRFGSCILFKPSIDNRFSTNNIVDRDNKHNEKAINISTLEEIYKYGILYENIFIDEFQFLTGNICIINDLLEFDCNLYVAGLNLTAERKPFGLMNDLLCFADTIHILKGNCDYCGKQNKGNYTLYEGGKHQDIIVGEDNYKCVCSKCYELHSNQGKSRG